MRSLLQQLTASQSRHYYGVALGKPKSGLFGMEIPNPNLTLFRRIPKVKGKANVKAAKRARQRQAGLR